MSYLKFFTGAKAAEREAAEAESTRRALFDVKILKERVKLKEERETFLSSELECSIATSCASCRHYDEGEVRYYFDTEPSRASDRSRIWLLEPRCKLWRVEK